MRKQKARYQVNGPYYADGIWFVYDSRSRFGIQDPYKESFPTRKAARKRAKTKNRRRTKSRRQVEGDSE